MILDNTIRVACLGAGYFSQFHFDAWERIEAVELVGIANRNIEKARQTGYPAFSDLGHMLEATTPDLLDIITPPETHLGAIKAALEHGVTAIICQKPFCTSLDEARTAVSLAADKGVPLIVHENFRFQPWYREMARALAAGDIGDVHQLTFRLRTGDGQGPDAYLSRQPYFQKMERFLVHETAVHWIDTFRFLLGDIQAVYADLRKMNPVIAGEDAGYIIFDFDHGVRAIFDGNRHLDHASENTRTTLGEALLEGTTGTITLAGNGALYLRSFGETATRTLLEPKDWRGFAGDCVFALQRHVVEGLLERRPFENTAADYLRVIEVEEAIYRSASEGRKQGV
ncbi:Gfo/Idh/MocA family oxidoreductase [Hoeflea sp. YIM 152468]|uniref:Gfo/Idh/MocA family protein n=1 Tax=Hoeflea sp. YIM 152468 TaxID=3031759 RepID=UPI0023DC00DF|nr:Gfo/Idh/MocA family oxidoreductase [Hoeflea sp. YIM 152468]MDF1610206.1 Gfo/Idh/MocA family oxidoreductase [Hoeflea sp. YIM 152468]